MYCLYALIYYYTIRFRERSVKWGTIYFLNKFTLKGRNIFENLDIHTVLVNIQKDQTSNRIYKTKRT